MQRFIPMKDMTMIRAKADGDLVVRMAFSSEEPVERWWGIEILDHSEKSVRLDRLNDGAAVLFNHNPNDLRGTHEPGSVKVDKDRILRGQIRIPSVTQTGRDTIGLVESRVLTKASIGYRVHTVLEQTTKRDGQKVERRIPGDLFERMIDDLERDRKADRATFIRSLDAAVGPVDRKEDEEPIYRVMDWEPFENSFVTIPADKTIGLGRSNDSASKDANPAKSAIHQKESVMNEDEKRAAEAAEAAEKSKREKDAREKAEREAMEKLQGRSAVDLEAARKRAIENFAKINKIADNIRDAWVNQGYSLEEVSKDLLNIMEERGKSNPQPASRLGLTQNEAQTFSLRRAILACRDNNWKDAPFELECSKAVAQKLNRVAEPTKFYVPFEVMQRQFNQFEMQALRERMGLSFRDLTVATAGAGGFLVATENLGFIEMLRNRSVAFRMGVRRLSGLQGSVTVPRQSAAATAVWLANEASTITESQQTFVQMALAPKNVGAYTEISRQLLLQSSPGVEGIVTDDLAQQVGLAADLAVLEGSGAGGQPTGISATAGIGSVTGTSLASAGIIEFQTDVAGSNVTPLRGGYVTTPAVAGLLMVRPELPSTGTERLWKGNIWDGRMFDFPAMTSNQLTAATMIFGDWQEVVVGEWGVLEVEVNPFANFQAGIIGIRAIYSMDVGVRRPFAFSRATTIT